MYVTLSSSHAHSVGVLALHNSKKEEAEGPKIELREKIGNKPQLTQSIDTDIIVALKPSFH